MSALPLGRILVGDAKQRLADLPDASIDCVISSPPYFAMRDYGHEQQIGAEGHIDGWVDNLLAVCAELYRVLTPSGSLFLNVGDGYARHIREGAERKSLLLGPERLALRLTADGWLLRNKIVWAKPNAMPSSVLDRLTTTHEFLYFFAKQQRYYFDLNAIREVRPGGTQARPGPTRSSYPPPRAVPLLSPTGTAPRIDLNQGLATMRARGQSTHPLGANPGDVWRIPTASFHGAHFATFPVELVRRPLLATCPEQVCTGCGQPWRRAKQVIDGRKLATGKLRPNCQCQAPSRPGIVLDPFCGAGTVPLAAEEHGRDWLGIELNPSYAALAERRLADWRAAQTHTKPETNNHREEE